METLPTEIIFNILAKMDLPTLMTFSRVSSWADEVTHSLSEFKAIKQHAPNALHGAFAIRAASWVTCQHLFKALCTAECEVCGDFGAYIYLLTYKRVCLLCLSSKPEFLPLRPSSARHKFGIGIDIVEALPHMRSIKGVWTDLKLERGRMHIEFVDRQSAHCAGVAQHGSQQQMEASLSDARARRDRARRKAGHRSLNP